MIILFVFLAIAVIQDFKSLRVSNRLILTGMAAGLFYRLLTKGLENILLMIPNIIFPIAVLYLLYLAGALGAGDIKLFSLVGCFTNFKELAACMVMAFVWGAFASLLKLILAGNVRQQLYRGGGYLINIAKGRYGSYQYAESSAKIHFSLEILLGYGTMILLEYVYKGGIFF